MKALKWVGYVIGALLGLLVLALALVWLFFDPNDYKADIERLVEQHTHRKLSLQGDLKLSVFPWVAVKLGPAQLGERAGFGADPFVALDEARLSIRLWPLLRGRVEIGDVLLRKPSIRLVTNERGEHNWSDLSEGSQESEPAPTSEGSVQASVASVHIEDGVVVLEDRQAKTRKTIRDFDFATGNIVSGKPFDLKTSFVLEQDEQRPLPVSLTTSVTADLEAERHSLKDLRLDSRWVSAGAQKSEGVPLSLRAQSAAVDLRAQTLALEGLTLAFGSANISSALSGKEILDAPQFTGTLELKPVSPRDLMREAGMTPPVTRDADVLKQLSLRAEVNATSNSVGMQQVELKLDDTTARGKLSIVDLKTTALRFDLNVDRIDFDRYLPPPAPESGSKTASKKAEESKPSAPTPIPVDTLKALNARGDLRIGEAKFAGMRLAKLHLGVNARDGDVRFAPTDAAIYGGQYRGALAINVASATPRLNIESHASGIDFKPLFKDMFETERVSGRGQANVKAVATGADTLAMQKSLGGTLDFNVTDGAIEGTDLWYEIRRARALFRGEPAPERSGPARTPFNSLKGTGVIDNGVLTNNDLEVAAQVLKIAGQGKVDLVQNALDYKLNVQVLRVTDDPKASELVDAQIPVKVTGSLSSPTVRPDIQGLVKARVQQEVEKQKEKVREKVQDKLQEKLQDLFKR